LKHQIQAGHLQIIGELVEQKEVELGSQKKLSPMEHIKKEDDMDDWLDNNGFQNNQVTGDAFVDAGISRDDLEAIRKNIGKEAFADVLPWVENLLSSYRIIKDLEEASTRISHLVGAIKSHVHMDRTNDLQPTDIHNDIENTLTLLGYKLREKNITVKKSFCNNLPLTPAYVGELNQVWTNLIDNAIFALHKNGELTIETTCDSRNVRVKIIDNGSGIPPEIISRIFDPFFTTKKVGEGTGIGLDLVNRVIKHHNGDIRVNSQPGKTEFAVCIPVAETKKA
jgi:signal transduction histidine kinase